MRAHAHQASAQDPVGDWFRTYQNHNSALSRKNLDYQFGGGQRRWRRAFTGAFRFVVPGLHTLHGGR